jgi:hypothetical protein
MTNARIHARTALAGAMLLAALLPARGAPAPSAQVDVERRGAAYHVSLDAMVDAPLPRVFAVLTNFAKLPALNPAIVAVSEQASPGGHGERVRSVLESCIWFFCRKVVQVEDVIEPDAHTILARIVPGLCDFKSGWSDWRLTAQGARTHLHYEASRIPDFWIPPLIGPWIVAQTLRSQLEASLPVLQRLANQPRARDSSSLTSE